MGGQQQPPPSPPVRTFTISVTDFGACPNKILSARHHVRPGRCACYDPNDAQMPRQGYKWDAERKRWR